MDSTARTNQTAMELWDRLDKGASRFRGSVLYTETPMNAYCLAVTHVRDFTREGFVTLLESCLDYGKRFKLEIYNLLIPFHFGFSITEHSQAEPGESQLNESSNR